MRIAGKDLTIYITKYIDERIHLQKETFFPNHAVQAVRFASRRLRERDYYFQLKNIRNQNQ
jgi:hypothetical protein